MKQKSWAAIRLQSNIAYRMQNFLLTGISWMSRCSVMVIWNNGRLRDTSKNLCSLALGHAALFPSLFFRDHQHRYTFYGSILGWILCTSSATKQSNAIRLSSPNPCHLVFTSLQLLFLLWNGPQVWSSEIYFPLLPPQPRKKWASRNYLMSLPGKMHFKRHTHHIQGV